MKPHVSRYTFASIVAGSPRHLRAATRRREGRDRCEVAGCSRDPEGSLARATCEDASRPFEGVAYKVSPGPVAGGTTVYRFYNRRAGTHFYTASDAERNTVMATLGGTYTYEGTAFYVGQ